MFETGDNDSLNVQSMIDDQTDLKFKSVEITDETHMLNQTIPYILYKN